ncbi:biotin-dependent carboxyltransferase family protein [Arthrobacter sp. NA-172]|uniref:5-oxoprolinase subunit C family protein n=1 Tax=Arthrobacter sp. NA-172 TaxID=3367524 RepID=UPI003754E55D
MGIVVVNPGPLTLVEDLGRQGWASLGLSPSGALDRQSLRLANLLAGNPANVPGLEILLGGLRLRFVTASTIAVAGAEGIVTLNGAEIPLNDSVRVAPGGVLDFGAPLFGLRYYLGVQGGIDAPKLLGSSSTDMLSGEGPAPLKSGDQLEVGRVSGGNGSGAAPGVGPGPGTNARALPAVRRAPDPGRVITARVDRGPRADWFDVDFLAPPCQPGMDPLA